MRVFDLELTPAIIDAIAAHGERDYPNEACGFVLGRSDAPELARVAPMKNVQDKYHQRDPVQFPRTGRDAFRLDELERMRMLEAAAAEGLVERIVYHSHPDAGAYFSPEDRAMAVQQGIELMPGIVHIVVSIRDGKRSDMGAFRWNAAQKVFEEARISLRPAESPLPDLELRSMEGRESARPIRPVGGRLTPRRITADERIALERIADRVQIRIDAEDTIRDIRRFELGLYSPLDGFLRPVEVRSIEQGGRLLSGTPWRTPVTLDLSAKKTSVQPAAGSIVELLNASGVALAAMGVSEVARVGKDLMRLGGPIFVFDSGAGRDAPETRAELLRLGARSVLAVGANLIDRARSLDLSEFDVVLSETPLSNARASLGLLGAGRDGWLDALMAQNQGATHVLVEDPALARAIEDTLAIAPWLPK
jgi:[CysO sulfur-carrier protein]-S-L-cysteine hydrolase